jgi:hypothetical protein
MTVCPVAAHDFSLGNQSHLAPSSSTLLLDADFLSSWDMQNDTIYAFVTPSMEQGIVHVKNDKNGVPWVYGISIGDTCAKVHENTPDHLLINAFDANTAPYRVWFDKRLQKLTISSADDTSVGLISVDLVSVDSEKYTPVLELEPQIIRTYPSSISSSLLDISIFLLLSSCSPSFSLPLLIGYFMGDADAHPLCVILEAVPALVGVTVDADLLYLTAVGGTLFYVSTTQLGGEIAQAKQNGFRILDKIHFAVKIQDAWQKYLYVPGTKVAIPLGELGLIDRVYLDLTDAVVQFRGNLLQSGQAFITYLGTSVGLISNKDSPQRESAAAWYRVDDIANVRGSSTVISEANALRQLKKCREKNIFIRGESWYECQRLTKKASWGKQPQPHEPKNYREKGHQYPHYHPVDTHGNKCSPHCFWVPSHDDL